jgi:protein SCO1/2
MIDGKKIFIALLFSILVWSGCAKPLPVLGQLPDFSFQDQNDKKVDRGDFLGKVWIADFIYTGCADICPMLTQKMSELEKKTPPDVLLASFTVDPENDTPARLALYAERFHVDFHRWFFLTGPLGDIEKVVVGGFKQSMGKVSLFEIMHGGKLVLVDRQGRIRGYYDADPSVSDGGMKALEKAVFQLVKEKR